MDNAEFYRNYELGDDPSEPFPEILPDSEYFVVETTDWTRPLAIHLMTKEEAAFEYGPYLAAKTFDLIAAGLQKLYGSDYYQKEWWHEEAALACMQLSANDPKIARRMLWSLQKSFF
jgi:hypothetical protein